MAIIIGIPTAQSPKIKVINGKKQIKKKEFKKALNLIYNFNLHNPDATRVEIGFTNKGLVPLLEEVGYKLEFQYELCGRFYYMIRWE